MLTNINKILLYLNFIKQNFLLNIGDTDLKIIVTGGSGFIGSNFIANQITNTNNNVLNIDKITYAGNPQNLRSISSNSNYSFKKVDICNYNDLNKALIGYDADAIVHFAAESHVDKSIEEPLSFINTNIVGTANLLQAIKLIYKDKKDFRFLHISTDEVFGTLGKDGYFNEMSPYLPNSPYSASKASSDHLVRAWGETYEIPYLITNCSNNYGPYQYPEKLIPLVILNCVKKKPIPVYGNGENIRDWIYVDDHCNAINLVLNKGKIGETYCIGGSNEIKNIDIVLKICSIIDELRPRKNNRKYKDLISFVEDRPGHDLRYAIDSSKISRELGLKPKESFESGISNTVKWYLDNESWWSSIND